MDHDRVLRQVLQETVHLFNYELLSDDERQHLLYFFFQAEDGIRDIGVTGSSDVCSSDLTDVERDPRLLAGDRGIVARGSDRVRRSSPPAESPSPFPPSMRPRAVHLAHV